MMNDSPRRQHCVQYESSENQRAAERAMSMPSPRRFCCSMRSMFRTDMRSALVAGCVFLAACGGEPYGAPARVIVPRGASFAQATDSLAKAKLVGRPRLFRLYGRLTGGDRNIKPGTYLLKPGTPW